MLSNYYLVMAHAHPHTYPHFELGFSVNAIATLGKKAIEQHGEKSDNLEVFQH